MKFPHALFRLKIPALFAVLCLATAAGGCYSTRTRLPEHAKTIAVPVFGNKTYIEEYTRGLEQEITESTRKMLLQNGKLTVQGRESADLILEGQINRYERRILRADRYGEPAEVQVVIHASCSLYDVKAAKYLIKGELLTNEREKPASGNYNLRRGEDENLARQRAIEDLGRAIARKVVDY